MDVRDIVEIQQLLALYGHVVDEPGQPRLHLVFTGDAVMDGDAVGMDVMEGRDAIAAFFALGAPPHPPSHNGGNVYVHEKAGETRATSKWLAIDLRDNSIVSGDYDDVLVRTSEGWRIRRRSFRIRHPVDYAKDMA